MVLISTENLERMQRQLQQHQHPITIDVPMENSRNLENTESANNSVQTPGTPLSRLDAEMNRILNSPLPNDEAERWKLYKEVLWRYLHFVRAAQRRNRMDARNAGEEEEESAVEDPNVEATIDESTLEHATSSSFSSPLNSTQIASHPREHNLESMMMKSVGGILESVPKSFRPRARLIINHLFDKAVPTRLSWNEHGVVTIDGNVVKNSNIAELINEATRARKTVQAVGRVQFARLLRTLNIPSEVVGNRKLLSLSSSNLEKFRPSTSSTPNTSTVGKSGEKRREEEKIDDPDLSPAEKRRLLDWSKLK